MLNLNEYKVIVKKLRAERNMISMEASDAIEALIRDNRRLQESYDAMYLDLEKSIKALRGKT